MSVILGKKQKELCRYVIIGISTTAFNLIVYQILLWLGMEYWQSNAIAILVSKVYAYITNKMIVFRSAWKNLESTLRELARFIMARGFTGILDYAGLIFSVEVLCIEEIEAKYMIQVIVVIINYILSKKLIFGCKS